MSSTLVLVLAVASAVVCGAMGYVVWNDFERLRKYIPFSYSLERANSTAAIVMVSVFYLTGFVFSRDSITTVVAGTIGIVSVGAFFFLAGLRPKEDFLGIPRTTLDAIMICVAAVGMFAALSLATSMTSRVLMTPLSIVTVLVLVEILRAGASGLPNIPA